MQLVEVVQQWTRTCGIQMPMNRIREIREAAGLSQQELAELVGTTNNTISRLEIGTQQLTQHWMQLLSEALKCTPADLISNVVLLETDGADVEPFTPDAAIAAAIAKKGLRVYRVTGRSVFNAGIRPDDTITVDESESAIAALQALDIVLIEAGSKRTLVLRQWIPPSTLLASKDPPTAISLNDPTVNPRIVGVVLREE